MEKWIIKNSIIIFPEIEKKYNIKVAFTTRNGGVSTKPYDTLNISFKVNDKDVNVLENRKIVAKELGIELKDFVIGKQIHSCNYKIITEQEKGSGAFSYETGITNTDAFITDIPFITLCVTVADCLPILIFDKNRRIISSIHSGWKGTFNNILNVILEKLIDMGCNPSDLLIFLGPAINKCCFEVSSQLFKDFKNKYNYLDCFETRDNKCYVDIRKINRYIFINKGGRKENIIDTDLCTYCNEKLFFSHRRDNGKTGRMFGIIQLNN